MTPEQINLWLEIQHRQMVALERIADVVERLAPATTAAPNYQRPLENFLAFGWESIGAGRTHLNSPENIHSVFNFILRLV